MTLTAWSKWSQKSSRAARQTARSLCRKGVLCRRKSWRRSKRWWANWSSERARWASREGHSFMAKVVGIDLGTTYSAIASVNSHGKAEIIVNREGDRITPSVVLFDSDAPIVGSIAKRSAI